MEEELARRMAAWWRDRPLVDINEPKPADPDDYLITIDDFIYDLLHCAMEVLKTPLEK